MKRALVLVLLAACSSSSSDPSAACDSVGTSLCQKMYSCYQGSDLASFGFPPTEAECETQQNANCGKSPPEPGYCKGNAQTSADNATACANELDALTCTELMQSTGSGACKTELCAM